MQIRQAKELRASHYTRMRDRTYNIVDGNFIPLSLHKTKRVSKEFINALLAWMKEMKTKERKK
jgi:hypothetical protein